MVKWEWPTNEFKNMLFRTGKFRWECDADGDARKMKMNETIRIFAFEN